MSHLRPVSRSVAFSGSDLWRLERAISAARRASTASLSALVGPPIPERPTLLGEHNAVFDHCGVLLFPRTSASGLAYLEQRGLAPLPVTPSTAVWHRLSERYGLDAATCAIDVTRLRLPLPDGRTHPAVEVFLFPRDRPGFGPRIEDSEVRQGFEDHTALIVCRPDAELLAEIISDWRAKAGLVWEGGGHNPCQDGPAGSTVFHFVREQADPVRPRRIELNCHGDLRHVSDWLTLDSEAVSRAYRAWQRPSAPRPRP